MWAGQLAAVVMATAAAAQASDGTGATGSSRAWEVRASFGRVPGETNTYFGNQGMDLADFINYAAGDANITSANWYSFSRTPLTKLGRRLVEIKPHADRRLRYSATGVSHRTFR